MTNAPGRDRNLCKSLGDLAYRKVKESRVLLVGAGGIGCELLKNLVCCGFGSSIPASQDHNGVQQIAEQSAPKKKAEIVVIDLDTIDLSNLNRQFLFRKQHIKKPKATVAKETANQFNPSVNIDAHYASIYDGRYDVEFFEGFDMVFNALDNLAARRHVNRMCLAADVPLIESGTTGFNGQVQAIKKGVTECYDCNEKEVPKAFPICTIRSTPSEPIHCIVWAKSYLLPELFGTSEEDSSDMQVTEGDSAEEVAKLKEEAEALKNIRKLMGKDDFAQEIFNKVFHDDIERLLSMAEMWQSRKAPQALRFESICIDPDPAAQGQAIALQDQNIWTLQDNLKVFCYATQTLSKRMQNGENVIEFDKDDKDTLDFVASAANLRAQAFGIPSNPEWEIKQMAGNIIPAIATSNALTASLCVFEAFKIIKSELPSRKQTMQPTQNNHIPTVVDTAGATGPLLGGAKMTFLHSKSTDRVILSQNLQGPRPDCPVCSPFYAKVHIKSKSSPTLQQLVDLLRSRLGYEDFAINADAGLIYDSDLEDNLSKPLADFGIDGRGVGFLTVQDESDEPKVDVQISVKVKEIENDLVLLPQSIALPLKPPKKTLVNGDNEVQAESDPILEPSLGNAKRKRDAEEAVESAKKRAKSGGGEPVYVVEDDGAILLDD